MTRLSVCELGQLVSIAGGEVFFLVDKIFVSLWANVFSGSYLETASYLCFDELRTIVKTAKSCHFCRKNFKPI